MRGLHHLVFANMGANELFAFDPTSPSILMAGSLIVYSMGSACLIAADRERKEVLAFVGLEVDARTFQKSIFPTLRRLTDSVMRESEEPQPASVQQIVIEQPCHA